MIIQSYARSANNTNDIAVTIDKDDLQKFMTLKDEITSIINSSNIHIDEDIAKISIVGAGMIDRPGIAAQMFETLAKEGINLNMLSTSEIKISCLVEKMHAKQATEALCKAFELDGKDVALVHGTLPD